jgi:hypothetical protein
MCSEKMLTQNLKKPIERVPLSTQFILYLPSQLIRSESVAESNDLVENDKSMHVA